MVNYALVPLGHWINHKPEQQTDSTPTDPDILIFIIIGVIVVIVVVAVVVVMRVVYKMGPLYSLERFCCPPRERVFGMEGGVISYDGSKGSEEYLEILLVVEARVISHQAGRVRYGSLLGTGKDRIT